MYNKGARVRLTSSGRAWVEDQIHSPIQLPEVYGRFEGKDEADNYLVTLPVDRPENVTEPRNVWPLCYSEFKLAEDYENTARAIAESLVHDVEQWNVAAQPTMFATEYEIAWLPPVTLTTEAVTRDVTTDDPLTVEVFQELIGVMETQELRPVYVDEIVTNAAIQDVT